MSVLTPMARRIWYAIVQRGARPTEVRVHLSPATLRAVLRDEDLEPAVRGEPPRLFSFELVEDVFAPDGVALIRERSASTP